VLEDQRKEPPPFVEPWERRGTDLSRILGLSDGVFAFALTLLVLNIALQPPSVLTAALPGDASCATVPPSFECEFRYLEPAFLTFVLGFLVIAAYWRLHHLVFAYIERWDQLLVQLNIALMALIALQPFLVTLLRDYIGADVPEDVTREVVFFYAGLSALTGFVLYAIFYHASRTQLTPRRLSKAGVGFIERSLLFTPVIFAISMAVAVPFPHFAAYIWFAIIIAITVTAHRPPTAGLAQLDPGVVRPPWGRRSGRDPPRSGEVPPSK
jgi:uncharacterized membrane protein